LIRTGSKNRRNFRVQVRFAALGALLGAAGLSAGSASAADETVLYSFCQHTNCADGAKPQTGVRATADGALYGTASQGGITDVGVAFLVAITGGGYGILHAFQGGNDGRRPFAPLFRDKSGNFYGTTELGGINADGTVFKRSAGGVYTLLHAFNGTDGSRPYAGFVADSAGNLYGTTFLGGATGNGTIFKLTPSGTLTTIYSFCSTPGCADGARPVAGLTADRKTPMGFASTGPVLRAT
jgi:uncharacterized repeat protein (TIGR03803 family)